jgi:cytochrome c556
MKRIVVVAAMLALSAGAVVAQQDQVKRTQAMMKDNGKNAGALAAMVKGEKPYDQSTVNAALAQFEDTAKNLPTLFPASLKGVKFEGDYSPSPKIWSDKAGFDAAIASFAKTVTEAKAKIKDLDSLKATMPAIGKECSNCHETFRVKG